MRRTSNSPDNASSIAGLISAPLRRIGVRSITSATVARPAGALPAASSSATAAGTADQGCEPIRTDFSPHGGSVPSGSAWSRMRLVTRTGSSCASGVS